MRYANIREELGDTPNQFRKLKEEILKEILYCKMTCARCEGTCVVESHPFYRVFERLQDEDLGCVKECPTLEEAESYVEECAAQPLGTSSMFTIVAPNGEIVG